MDLNYLRQRKPTFALLTSPSWSPPAQVYEDAHALNTSTTTRQRRQQPQQTLKKLWLPRSPRRGSSSLTVSSRPSWASSCESKRFARRGTIVAWWYTGMGSLGSGGKKGKDWRLDDNGRWTQRTEGWIHDKRNISGAGTSQARHSKAVNEGQT
jgi:hypothetical protein